MNLPDYNFLSAPLWLFNVLHLLTLTLHFVAMNFVVGSIVALLWGRFSDNGNRSSHWSNDIVARFVKLLPSGMALTVTLGVAPLLFVQLLFPKQVYSASIVSAWFWLAIPLVVACAYYFLYAASFSRIKRNNGTYLGLALIGLLYVSFVYSSVFSMAEDETLIAQLYACNQSGFAFNTHFGGYILRWLHMLLGAITVGGFFVGLIGHDNQRATASGRKMFLWGMVIASVVGLVYLITLGESLLPMMRTSGIWALTIGIVFAPVALHFFYKKWFWLSGITLLISMLGMVTTRHYLRLIRLYWDSDANALVMPDIPVTPQWSIFFVFLICFVVAIGAVYWMVRKFFQRPGQAAN